MGTSAFTHSKPIINATRTLVVRRLRLRRSRLDGSRASFGERGPNITPANIAPGDVGVGLVREDKLGVALSGIARPGVAAVHPVHEIAVAVPDREDEDHAALESAAHGGEAAEALAFGACGVAVFLGIVRFVFSGHGRETYISDACEALTTRCAGGIGVCNHLSILHVRAADVDQSARGGTIVGDELGLWVVVSIHLK